MQLVYTHSVISNNECNTFNQVGISFELWLCRPKCSPVYGKDLKAPQLLWRGFREGVSGMLNTELPAHYTNKPWPTPLEVLASFRLSVHQQLRLGSEPRTPATQRLALV